MKLTINGTELDVRNLTLTLRNTNGTALFDSAEMLSQQIFNAGGMYIASGPLRVDAEGRCSKTYEYGSRYT